MPLHGTELHVGAMKLGNASRAKVQRQAVSSRINQQWEEVTDVSKSFEIPKQYFVEAWRRVKANRGSSGVDAVSIERFEENLQDNLYKIWNRMSSGCYFPPSVKAVSIPKKSGGERILGIPTVADRVAQMVVKLHVESEFESLFLADSYGYRAGKSAHDAIAVTRQRCWRYAWVLEFDIKGLFDNLSHELLMKAVEKHVKDKWCLITIERWLKAGLQLPSKEIAERTSGTPQGGVISPLLANLFLHYAFDRWMTVHHPHVPWCRYADDGLLHCKTKKQAEFMLAQLRMRFKACGLELHPLKTRIVYCRDGLRTERHEHESFTFLGFEFRQRKAADRTGRRFMSILPGVGKQTLARMRETINREWRVSLRTESELKELAKSINPTLRGWINYYGKFYSSALRAIARYLNEELSRWLIRKYQKLRLGRGAAFTWLRGVYQTSPRLFVHWERWKMA